MMTLAIMLSSLIINFGVISYGDVAPNYQYIVDDIQAYLSHGNSWQQSYSFTPDEYWIVFRLEDGTYRVFIPREVPEPSYSSSIVVNSLINDIGLSVTFYNYVLMNYDGSNVGFEWNNSYNYSFYYYNADDTFHPRLLFVGQDSFYYDGEYQVNLLVDEPSFTVTGHSSGFSSLIEETENGSYTVFGHSNGNVTNENTWTPGSLSSTLSDRLLTGIGNLLSGINDSISYGFGVLIQTLSLLPGAIEDFKTYVEWLTTIPSPSAVWTSFTNQGYFGMIVNEVIVTGHSIYNNTTLETAAEDFYFDFNFSGCTIPGFNGRYLFHASDWFDPIKDRYQNFLITLIYGFVAFRFLRGLPNLIQGLSATFHKGGEPS